MSRFKIPQVVTAKPGDSKYDGFMMTLPDGREFHLGYSRLSSYLSCPKAYKFSYIDKVKFKSTLPILRGQAYHGAVEKILGWRIENPTGSLKLTKVERLAIMCAEAEGLKGKDIDKVVEAVNFYVDTKFKTHRPLQVEYDFAVARGGVKITGRIDLIEDYSLGRIADHKFSSDIWAAPRAQYGCQPIIYQWAALDCIEKLYPGWKFKQFAYEIVRLWPYPKIQTIAIDKVSQAQSDWWEDSIFEAAKAIRKGFFPAIPTEKGCQWCFHKKICNPTIYDVNISATGEEEDQD